MSQQNIDLLRQANRLFNAGAWEAWSELLHPDIEFHDLMHAPDVPEVVYGRDAVRLVVEGWTDTYDDFGVEVSEFVDVDPWVVCATRWYGRGKGSGLPVDLRSADAYELSDGKVVRVISGLPDVAAALDAVTAARPT